MVGEFTVADGIALGVRAFVALGSEVVTLIAAMRAGDVSTVAELAKRLDPPDEIIANAEAVRVAQFKAADRELP